MIWRKGHHTRSALILLPLKLSFIRSGMTSLSSLGIIYQKSQGTIVKYTGGRRWKGWGLMPSVIKFRRTGTGLSVGMKIVEKHILNKLIKTKWKIKKNNYGGNLSQLKAKTFFKNNAKISNYLNKYIRSEVYYWPRGQWVQMSSVKIAV